MEDSTTEETVDKLGMTDEQWAWFQKATHGYGDQDENGIDLSLLRENLKLTPTERLDKMVHHAAAFGDLLSTLNKGSVRYILIGSHAVAAYGADYGCQDVDLCYDRADVNMVAFVSALAPFRPRLHGAHPGLPIVWDLRTLKAAPYLPLMTDLGLVDLLGEAAGVSSFEGLWERSVVLEVEGVRVHVASLDDMIAMKRAAGRPKDQKHLMELDALKKLVQDESIGGA